MQTGICHFHIYQNISSSSIMWFYEYVWWLHSTPHDEILFSRYWWMCKRSLHEWRHMCRPSEPVRLYLWCWIWRHQLRNRYFQYLYFCHDPWRALDTGKFQVCITSQNVCTHPYWQHSFSYSQNILISFHVRISSELILNSIHWFQEGPIQWSKKLFEVIFKVWYENVWLHGVGYEGTKSETGCKAATDISICVPGVILNHWLMYCMLPVATMPFHTRVKERINTFISQILTNVQVILVWMAPRV